MKPFAVRLLSGEDNLVFRFLAVGGGLALLLLWAGPIIVQASRRTMKSSGELYDATEAEATEDEDKTV